MLVKQRVLTSSEANPKAALHMSTCAATNFAESESMKDGARRGKTRRRFLQHPKDIVNHSRPLQSVQALFCGVMPLQQDSFIHSRPRPLPPLSISIFVVRLFLLSPLIIVYAVTTETILESAPHPHVPPSRPCCTEIQSKGTKGQWATDAS